MQHSHTALIQHAHRGAQYYYCVKVVEKVDFSTNYSLGYIGRPFCFIAKLSTGKIGLDMTPCTGLQKPL